jgi:hypothetical protein
MNVKPSILWLTTDSDALLINDSNVVLTAIAANSDIYKTPNPPLAAIQTALDTFTSDVAAAADGGPSATSKKNNSRLILAGLMRQLANYVASACNGDMTNLLLSGFPAQKSKRQPIGPLPAPTSVTLALGNKSGDLAAKANPVFGAVLYTWNLTSNEPNSTPQTMQSTAARVTFSGLKPGVTYTVVANAIGTAGASDWSNPATQMAV